jgi:hypothetical protein
MASRSRGDSILEVKDLGLDPIKWHLGVHPRLGIVGRCAAFDEVGHHDDTMAISALSLAVKLERTLVSAAPVYP